MKPRQRSCLKISRQLRWQPLGEALEVDAVPDEAVSEEAAAEMAEEAVGEVRVAKVVKVAPPRPGRDTNQCPQRNVVTAITPTELLRGSA